MFPIFLTASDLFWVTVLMITRFVDKFFADSGLSGTFLTSTFLTSTVFASTVFANTPSFSSNLADLQGLGERTAFDFTDNFLVVGNSNQDFVSQRILQVRSGSKFMEAIESESSEAEFVKNPRILASSSLSGHSFKSSSEPISEPISEHGSEYRLNNRSISSSTSRASNGKVIENYPDNEMDDSSSSREKSSTSKIMGREGSQSIASLNVKPILESDRQKNTDSRLHSSQKSLSPLEQWGELLFSEKRLSSNSKVSCLTCHDPKKGFTDGKKNGIDIQGHRLHRNSQSLMNVRDLSVLTWANPILKSLEQQILVPLFLDTPGEMGLSKVWPSVQQFLIQNPAHKRLFDGAFPGEQTVESAQLVKALAAYLRTLTYPESDYDRFLKGDQAALGVAARQGRSLFYSKRIGCNQCHSGALLTRATHAALQSSADPLDKRYNTGPLHPQWISEPFANTGLYTFGPLKNLPPDVVGLYEFTQNEKDLGRFRIPSLRHVRRTGPYMHDGSLATLEEVIEHYNKGGLKKCVHADTGKDCRPQGNVSPFVRNLGLNGVEKKQLIAFLKTL